MLRIWQIKIFHWNFGAVKAATLTSAIKISFLKGMNAVLSSLFFALFNHQTMTKSNNLLDKFVTLSFPIYIFHVPPCMVLSAVLIGMVLSQGQVLIGAVLGAFVLGVVLYYLLIKFTPIGWIIWGYKNHGCNHLTDINLHD